MYGATEQLLFKSAKPSTLHTEERSHKADKGVRADGPHFGHLARIRAFVLYSLHPYDQSIWRCMRGWRWWLLNMLGLIPYFGQVCSCNLHALIIVHHALGLVAASIFLERSQ